jgi:uncharacterized protein (DUF1330 family)
MPAYFIVDIDVTDPTAFEEYRKAVPATVEKYGGKFLVRGGRMEVVEGGWRPKRVVVTEFPNAAALRSANHHGHAGRRPRRDAGTARLLREEEHPTRVRDDPHGSDQRSLRMEQSDVRYRFVSDMSTLEG